VSKSSRVVSAIANDIGEVHEATAQIADASNQVKTSAAELFTLAEKLNQMVGRFKI
jgi:methyl-accepting chemotaxis protein